MTERLLPQRRASLKYAIVQMERVGVSHTLLPFDVPAHQWGVILANAAALIWESLPDVNWVGFYRNVGGELVVGPFQGRPACIRIPFGTGVCGAAAATLEIQRIDDVHAFPGHIACDAASASEIVVPIVRGGELIAVLDIDSPTKGRFSEEDEAGCERLGEILAGAL